MAALLEGLLIAISIQAAFMALYIIWAKRSVRHHRRAMNENDSEDLSLRLH
jgi:hypothetical protein